MTEEYLSAVTQLKRLSREQYLEKQRREHPRKCRWVDYYTVQINEAEITAYFCQHCTRKKCKVIRADGSVQMEYYGGFKRAYTAGRAS